MEIARPTIGIMALGKKQQTNSKHNEDPNWMWQNDQQVFDTFKEKLPSPPTLAYPDISKPFAFHTDSCQTGLSAVLYQCEDVVDKVIADASICLSRAEKELF